MKCVCPVFHVLLIIFHLFGIICLISWVGYVSEILLKNLDKLEPTLNKIGESAYIFSERIKIGSNYYTEMIEKYKNVIRTVFILFIVLAVIGFIRSFVLLKTIFFSCPCTACFAILPCCSKRLANEVIAAVKSVSEDDQSDKRSHRNRHHHNSRHYHGRHSHDEDDGGRHGHHKRYDVHHHHHGHMHDDGEHYSHGRSYNWHYHPERSQILNEFEDGQQHEDTQDRYRHSQSHHHHQEHSQNYYKDEHHRNDRHSDSSYSTHHRPFDYHQGHSQKEDADKIQHHSFQRDSQQHDHCHVRGHHKHHHHPQGHIHGEDEDHAQHHRQDSDREKYYDQGSDRHNHHTSTYKRSSYLMEANPTMVETPSIENDKEENN